MTIIHITPDQWETVLPRIQQAKRLALELNRRVPDQPTVSNVAVYSLLERTGWRCPCCHKRDDLTLTYVRPLAHGGAHHADNIRPICWSCLTVQQAVAIWLKWTPAHRTLPPTRGAQPVYVNPAVIAHQMGAQAIGGD